LIPDGKHFVVVTSPDVITRETHVTFLLNFRDELKRRLGAGGAK
jgi:hypothetical protein